jgi:hypothetical protein
MVVRAYRLSRGLETGDDSLARVDDVRTQLIVGFVLMVFGLALGVTMNILPVGIVVGLPGAASS